jgi:chorismate mutase
MKTQINEVKRMQQLAGLINESIIDLSDESNILNQIHTTISEEGMENEKAKQFLQEIINFCQEEIKKY